MPSVLLGIVGASFFLLERFRMNPLDTTHMTEIEENLIEDYKQEHGSEGLTYRAEQLISTLASMIEDEQRLEAVCKKHGSAYMTKGDKGQEVHKHRPEHVELMKVRQMKLQYLKQLGLGVAKDQVESW